MKNDRLDLFHVERIQLTSARRSLKTVLRHNGMPEAEPHVPRGTLPRPRLTTVYSIGGTSRNAVEDRYFEFDMLTLDGFLVPTNTRRRKE